MSKLIEVELGKILEINNKPYICVEDNIYTKRACIECDLTRDLCKNLACSKIERSDKTDVHFIRQKGGDEW